MTLKLLKYQEIIKMAFRFLGEIFSFGFLVISVFFSSFRCLMHNLGLYRQSYINASEGDNSQKEEVKR